MADTRIGGVVAAFISRGQDMHSPHPRVNVLGIGISAINMEQALTQIDAWIARREHQYVCVSTVHGVMECQRDPTLRQIFNRSGLSTPDGMPLVWLSRWQGFPRVSRVYGPDLLLAVCKHSLDRGYRHFFYGGSEGVADELRARLEQSFPGLLVVGAYCPPFHRLAAAEEAAIIRRINDAAPDIVWVGLSTPKQDRWMAAHVGELSAAVLIGIGAAFDFHAGRKRQAPLWMQRHGLEWLFRLTQEPRRLWRRYLVYNPLFIGLVLLQFLGIRRYETS
jgi:N-acetylglucosaminyldiphosphoundecaprenol N-acetyl-beta-D-mannosaminyltransferase